MYYFDLHCDTAYECYVTGEDFLKNNLAISGESGGVFDNWHQVFAIWIKDDLEKPFELYKKILSDIKLKLQKSPQNLTQYFSVEGGAVIEYDIDRLYILKQDSVRFLTLAWNGENDIAGGVNTEKTLTGFGKRVIREMNKLGMVCDLSHLNAKSFYKVAENAEKIVATHSNCYEICPHKRNLTDAQIKLIYERKGVMGICFYPDFLGGEVFEKIYENIFYLCDKGYEDIIAIGSDFDGGRMNEKLDKISKIPQLYEFLRSKGLKNELLYKIFYKNAHNFIAKLCEKRYYIGD